MGNIKPIQKYSTIVKLNFLNHILYNISFNFLTIFGSYKLDQSSELFQKQVIVLVEEEDYSQKGIKNDLEMGKKLEFSFIFNNFVNCKNDDEVLHSLNFISMVVREHDVSFLEIPQINIFLNQCFQYIHDKLYLEQILICFSAFSFQSFELAENFINSHLPIFEFFFDFLFEQKNSFELIINTISRFSKMNILLHDKILSVLLDRGGFQSVLRYMIKAQINEEKVFQFSNFLYSLALYPIHQIEAFEDIFECIDTVLQSQFNSSFLRISQTVKNILYNLLKPFKLINSSKVNSCTNFSHNKNNTDSNFNEQNPRNYDDRINNNRIKLDNGDLDGFNNDNNNDNDDFDERKIQYIINSFNDHFIIEYLFDKIDRNEDLIKYVCVSAGLLRYYSNINDQVDLKKIANLVYSSNDDIVICSSRCFADFCYLDPAYSLRFFNLEYFNCILKKFEIFTMEKKIDISFQIIIFSLCLPLGQLFEYCTRKSDISLISIFAQIANTKILTLLDLLLKLVLNIINYSKSVSRESEMDNDELFAVLNDIQSSDIFNEISQTRIPEMINMILYPLVSQ